MSVDAPITPEQSEMLLDIAEVAIRACFDGTRFPGPDVARLPERLRRPCGAFVTLHVDGHLNGCIGNIDSTDAIGSCVAKLAIQAAFEDPRLPKLRQEDLNGLDLEVSLLSPRVTVPAGAREELIGHLTPRTHGLILSSGSRRAVFLPSVWRQLPEPDDFIERLLEKAGLPTTAWPDDMHAEVFTTQSFARRLA